MDQRIKVLKPEFWESRWRLAKKISTIKINKENRHRWSQFWNFMCNIYDEIEKNNEEMIEKIIGEMKKDRLFTDDSIVLEIGSGTGAFTIPISKDVKQIIALDSSQLMLEKLEQKIKELNIANIKTFQEEWGKVNFAEKFDFVFAAFCPATNSKESLIKMKELSRGYACLVSIARKDEQLRMRNEIWELITGGKFISESYHILYPFGILYSLGYRPQLRKIDLIHTVSRDKEKLIEQFERYFNIFISLTEYQRKLIKDFINNYSANSKINFSNRSEIYLLWW